MNDLLNLTNDSLESYFNSLSKLGYKNYEDTYKVLVLVFLMDLLNLDFMNFMSENDYKEITRAIYHIAAHSRIIKFPSFPTYDDLVKDITITYASEVSDENTLIVDGEDIVLLKM